MVSVALRYTLAGCMFAIPRPYISISSPCQVSCRSLNNSIGYQITQDDSQLQPGDDFCRAGSFPDNVINTCAFCYSFIPQQLFLANCTDFPKITSPDEFGLTQSSLTGTSYRVCATTRSWPAVLSGRECNLQRDFDSRPTTTICTKIFGWWLAWNEPRPGNRTSYSRWNLNHWRDLLVLLHLYSKTPTEDGTNWTDEQSP